MSEVFSQQPQPDRIHMSIYGSGKSGKFFALMAGFVLSVEKGLAEYVRLHPQAIVFTIQVAIPDPEYMAAKEKSRDQVLG